VKSIQAAHRCASNNNSGRVIVCIACTPQIS